jgi:hypothetical protein
MTNVHSPSLDPVEAGAPEEEEFEVTSEMIRAGVDAHAGYNPEFDDIEDVICDIWMAMTVASRN